jgi:hypothetical protein
MFISHVLYKVDHLADAVKKLEKGGFQVHVPGNVEDAFHAIVWFETGPYLEVIVPEKSMSIPHWIMNLTGYGLFVKRQKKWCDSPIGWCDFGIESYSYDLKREKEILRNLNIKFKAFNPKVKNPEGEEINWWNVVIGDNNFPFMVSAYNIDPRPTKIVHPNGAREVESVLLGKEGFDKTLFQNLMTCKQWYDFTDGSGVQGVSFKGTSISFEEIL